MSKKDYLYPDISVQQCRMIEVMRRMMSEHNDYMMESPYPEEVRRYFSSWFETKIAEAATAAPSSVLGDQLMGEDRYEALYKEVVDLYVQLKTAKPSNADASEAMQYFRTITGLMDKLVSHQERALGIKQVHQFHTVVMDIMENVLTEEQRNNVMEQLKNAIKSD